MPRIPVTISDEDWETLMRYAGGVTTPLDLAEKWLADMAHEARRELRLGEICADGCFLDDAGAEAPTGICERSRELMADRIKLGDTARDTITGFEGVVMGRTEWLNGCVRLHVQPRALGENGKPVAEEWFDEQQLELVEEFPVAEVSTETTGGPRPHPVMRADPARS